MGKIIAELNGNKIVVTRYESNGFIIPDRISQEKKIISIINSSIDTDEVEETVVDSNLKVVPRNKFIYKLLSESGEESKDNYLKYCKGLYSERDMNRGITWAEASYLIYFVGGLEKSLDWNTIKPTKGFKVSVVQDIISGQKYISDRLASYKNRLDMEYYIKAIIKGERYVPFPLYCAFKDLENKGVCPVDEVNMFRKMSEKELEELF